MTPSNTFSLRPEVEADAAFRLALFRASRGPGWDQIPLPPEMLTKIMEQQFNAQTQGYATAYPDARLEIIEIDGAPAGRLATRRADDTLHLIDIALTPDQRGQGVGETILRALMDEASALSVPMTLHVALDNLAAQRLYHRLGFVALSADETHLALRWPAPPLPPPARHQRRGMTRVAVVGCGAWGRNLVRTCGELGVLAAVVDDDPAAAQAQATAWNVPALSLPQALADAGLDALIIATPAPTHAALCRLALDHGKDVFVEKPLASDLAEAEALAVDVRRSDRVFMIGHLLRHHPAFEALLGSVARGEIGALRYISASRLSLGRVRAHENVFLSFSPHDVSMILALVDAAPDTVHAAGRAFVTPGIVDEAQIDLGFPGGVHAHIAASWLSPFKEQKLVVVGETGALVFDDVRPWPEKLAWRRQGVAMTAAGPTASGAEPTFVDLVAEPPLTREVRHFLECCRTRLPPLTGIEEGLHVQRVLERVQTLLKPSSLQPFK